MVRVSLYDASFMAVIALFFAVYFTFVFLFLSSRSVKCSHCFHRYLFAFNVSTLLSTYDSNDFMTIPFYCYLYLILHSLSFIWNEELIDFP